MRIKRLNVKKTWEGFPLLEITLPKGEYKHIEPFLSLKDTDLQEYELSISKRRQMRSLDANAYCWVLCHKLAEVLGSTDEEIYICMVHEYGVSEIVPIKDNEVDEKIEFYSRQGLGDHAFDMGKCKGLKGFHNIKRYYGSSGYTSKQMARLIDGLVYEAKEQGIEVLPSEEIQRLKEMWK